MNGGQLMRWLGRVDCIRPEDRDAEGHFDEDKALANIRAEIEQAELERQNAPAYIA
jgi:hypothetical protein